MSISHFSFVLSMACLAGGIGACGSAGQSRAGSADDEDAETTGDERSTGSSDFGEPAPDQPKCDDGTCIECGDAICPNGYYCDEGQKPPLCAWIPACVTDASCACLGRALSGCECESRGSGSYVTCKD